MRWVGHVARTGGKENAFRVMVEKSELKISLVRHRCRRDNSIKVDVKNKM
jgi:hypothetical protein